MEKKVVIIKKETVNYLCQICGRLVHVVLGIPIIIETDKSIIHSWDYGHQHKRIYTFVRKKPVVLENTVDQSYE